MGLSTLIQMRVEMRMFAGPTNNGGKSMSEKKEIMDKLEEAVSDTGRSMLGLKNEYYRLKDIQADLKYELRKVKDEK